jgi:hypothetical protein
VKVKRHIGKKYCLHLKGLTLSQGRKHHEGGSKKNAIIMAHFHCTSRRCVPEDRNYHTFLNPLFEGHWSHGTVIVFFINSTTTTTKFAAALQLLTRVQSVLNPWNSLPIRWHTRTVSNSQTVKFIVLAASINTNIQFISEYWSNNLKLFVIKIMYCCLWKTTCRCDKYHNEWLAFRL